MVATTILGESGLSTPRLVLGGNVFGWTVKSREDSFRILDRFAEAGGVMIDTADVYSAWAPGNRGGESETIIGEWLKRRGGHDGVLIATKVGFSTGLSKRSIAEAVDASLARLGVETIDLYYAHKDDPATPQEESAAAFDALVKAGKVRMLGASNFSADRFAAALDLSAREGLARYEVLQPRYNLVQREEFEGALQDLCVARGVAVLPYYGLASGFLTGKYRSKADIGKSVRGDRMSAFLDGNGLAVLAALDAIAAEIGATPAQVALAWLAAQPAIAAPIASATSVAQLEELLGVLTLELDPDQLARLSVAAG
ncbi:aldo/keto reductase [Sphingosinicella ginsenosidimutans]|uniref:Aldo/keto reductase n=1 Tax=Allosphingosinicella ginsenosidimutans TaxID=1176539 RepID=A0A5C6TRG4_9SPHN|nr:aldo/keto reductase [Sphingosinicella ginsenosidimutans]TXC62535.1 aldo/keto reductase [Sphingosinicella ginsenosidimutans]